MNRSNIQEVAVFEDNFDGDLSDEMLDEGLPSLENRQYVKCIKVHSSDEILSHKGCRRIQNKNYEYKSCCQISAQYQIDYNIMVKRIKYQKGKASLSQSREKESSKNNLSLNIKAPVDLNRISKERLLSGSLKEDVRFLLRCNIAQKMMNTHTTSINKNDFVMNKDDCVKEIMITPEFDNAEIVSLRKFSSVTIKDIMPANECNN